jgi:hypothetical protein
MNIRQDRNDHREWLKYEANRNGHLASTHPQARRGIEEGIDQVEEAMRVTICNDQLPDSGNYQHFGMSTKKSRAKAGRRKSINKRKSIF